MCRRPRRIAHAPRGEPRTQRGHRRAHQQRGGASGIAPLAHATAGGAREAHARRGAPRDGNARRCIARTRERKTPHFPRFYYERARRSRARRGGVLEVRRVGTGRRSRRARSRGRRASDARREPGTPPRPSVFYTRPAGGHHEGVSIPASSMSSRDEHKHPGRSSDPPQAGNAANSGREPTGATASRLRANGPSGPRPRARTQLPPHAGYYYDHPNETHVRPGDRRQTAGSRTAVPAARWHERRAPARPLGRDRNRKYAEALQGHMAPHPHMHLKPPQ